MKKTLIFVLALLVLLCPMFYDTQDREPSYLEFDIVMMEQWSN
ncbi:hypothetical protein CUZ56_01138 [Saezia sanguinis]|jgi:hypothetical protein|uniref:Uncharacterized protein n=1 Tax=Saezia sanguinis TaxID=1965230 RepID=A0A433SEN2_9BURK|nr:hypothetical protein [Saezia sanguinis]RUS67197.1 hypothetical protein CUZ56_01138 [Saezia sanguinis]